MERQPSFRVIGRLSATVAEAASFFAASPENLADGSQTARQVLSHLVFWHREYITILRDLLEDRPLELREGKFRQLNEQAYAEFRELSMQELVILFVDYQTRLEGLLEREPGSHLRMPIKKGSTPWNVIELMERVEAHIRGHLQRLRTAQRSRERSLLQ